MLDHPAGIDAGVVRHHIAGQSDAASTGTFPQVFQRFPTAKVSGHFVVIKRISRGDRIRVAADLFYLLRRRRSFPESDQPESGKASSCKLIKFGIRYLVKPGNRVAVGATELIKPDIDHLGH